MTKPITKDTPGLTITLTTEPEDLDPKECFDDPEQIKYVQQKILEGILGHGSPPR